MVKKLTSHAEDVENMLSTYRRENVLHVDLEKQVKLDITTGLETNKKSPFLKNSKRIYSVLIMM